MTLDIDPRLVLTVFLLACRIGATLLLTPLLGSGVPVQVRVLVVIVLAAALSGPAGARYGGALDLGGVFGGMVSELLLGAILAFGVHSAFAVFAMAGKLLDVQTGFGLGSVFDPVSRAKTPILATALNMLAVTAFFALDGHHALLRGLVFSIEQAPVGVFVVPQLEPLVRQFGAVFTLGLAIIAPVFVCLFVVELATAVMSRVLPQANVLVAVMPVKIVVGLSVLAVSLPNFGPVMQRAYASVFIFWQEALRHG
jgi:flagellar biosynthesis protein FliR